MTILYVSTCSNKLMVVQVDEKGNLVQLVQTVKPIDPLPPNINKNKGSNKLTTTQWIDKHPKFPLLYALTSFGNEASAVVTTYSIAETTGKLTKLGRGSSCATGGLQATHATFSPDGSTYVVVGHHHDGRLSFFDATKDQAPLTEPFQILRLAALEPGTTFQEPTETWLGMGTPSVHSVAYAPNSKYLIVAEPEQNVIITFPCDAQGRLLQHEKQQYSYVKTKTNVTPVGWIQQGIGKLLGFGSRVRRAVAHPSNGKYLYCLHEFVNIIQVYAVDDDQEVGNITDGHCLQEIKIAELDLAKKCWIGLGFTAAAELQAFEDCLMVSVRGFQKASGSQAESSICCLRYLQDGRRLELAEHYEMPAPVRHFCRQGDTLWVGMNSASYPYVQKYVKHDGKFELTGEAKVGVDVYCVVAVEEEIK